MNPHNYRLLRSGSLTVEYADATLRNISLNGTEILRMVYAAVRDEKWISVPHRILKETIEAGEHDFRVQLSVLYKLDTIEFIAEFDIRGQEDSSIIFGFRGKALKGFMKNRIGICVLHPPETCRGKECMITHPDGSAENLIFPESIFPHQPFKDISAMEWEFQQNAKAHLDLEGDVFETEDQRNWTDASYKTYSTPLSIPFPAYIEKDAIIDQKATLTVSGNPAPVNQVQNNLIFEIDFNRMFDLPEIGVGVSSGTEPLSPDEATLLKDTCFRHIRAELHLFSDYWAGQYKKMMHESVLLGLPVELCLLFGNDPKVELSRFLKEFERNPAEVKSLIILSGIDRATPGHLISGILPEIRQYFKGIQAGAGTNCNFAELNRAGMHTESLDFLSFAIHPQEHASDDRTLFENTAAQKDAVDSARLIARNKPVHVSPVTLQRRFNANVSNFETINDGRTGFAEDPRLHDPFGAAWTVGSLKYLVESGASSVTYFETKGSRGVLNGNEIFPVYQVFRSLKPGYQWMRTTSSNPLHINGFAVVKENKGLIVLANLTRQKQAVRCTDPVHQVLLLEPYKTKICEFKV